MRNLPMTTSSTQSTVVITPKRSSLLPDFGELFRYKDLIMILAKKDFNLRYKQTVLGPAWAFINPLLTSLVQIFIFGAVAQIGTGDVPRILFYLFSNNIWSVFETNLSDNAQTFLANRNLFGKVYFPRIAVPISKLLVILFRWCIQTVVALPLYIYFLAKGAFRPHYALFLLIPAILLWLSVMGCSIGMIVSSATTRYRDLSMLVGFSVTLLMYVTPVVYPLSELDGTVWKTFAMINPVSAPCELFRYILFGSGQISVWSTALSLVSTVILAFLGLIVFGKVETNFIDTV